jgi:replicative DNA helicase
MQSENFVLNFRAGQGEQIEIDNGRAPRYPFESWETGLSCLDEETVLGGGLHPGETSVVAAVTGRGKSAFADQLADKISMTIPTSYFSFEMGSDTTTERLIAKRTGYTVLQVRKKLGEFPVDPKIEKALEVLQYERHLHIIEGSLDEPMTLDDCFDRILLDQSRFVIFDSMDFVVDWSVQSHRADYPARDVFRRLRSFIKQHRIHVMSVHQLKAPMGPNRKPDVGDMADSYFVSKAADTVIIIHRPDIEGDFADVAEFLVRKNRNGRICTLPVEWYGQTMSYRDMMPSRYERYEASKVTRKKSA